MDRDTIIRLAREVGLPYMYQTGEVANLELVERFAALVAAHEREECAKIVDDWYNSLASEPEMAYIAAEIRSRT